MKVLVTGGAGFIGSQLAETLCRRGARVVILDDFSTGRDSNLSWCRSGDAVEVIRGGVEEPATVRQAVAGCDWVFHEAALVSVPRSVEQPVESHRRNVLGTLELLVAAREARVRRFVFASSCAVYGENPEPFKHEGLPPQPLSPYALQKLTGEAYLRQFHTLFGLETVSLRYFNVFGPRQAADSPYAGVIARFCDAFLTGQPPCILGDGGQSRDFVYVANVVAANLAAAERPAATVAGRVFNIGTGRSLTLLELVAELQRQTGLALAPRFGPARAGDIRHSCPDIRAAEEGLGYRVETDWQEGLARTLEFYRSGAAPA
jgi:UDP-glucose 4-epimerase